MSQTELMCHMPTQDVKEKHANMFSQCALNIFPSNAQRLEYGIKLTNVDPFALNQEQEATNFGDILRRLKPQTLISLSVVMPSLHTSINFIQEWEHVLDSQMELPYFHQHDEPQNTTQTKFIEISNMHLEHRKIGQKQIVNAFILWPVIQLISKMLEQNVSIPIFVKLILIQIHFQSVTRTISNWTSIPLIFSTILVNSYTLEDMVAENIKFQQNKDASKIRIKFNITHKNCSTVIFSRDDNNKWKIEGNNECSIYREQLLRWYTDMQLPSNSIHPNVADFDDEGWIDV